MRVNCVLNKRMKITRNVACAKLEERLLPPLFTFTELLAITVTTLRPPKKPLPIVAKPSALRSLFTLDLLFSGSNWSTALILNKDSILAINVIARTLPQKPIELTRLKLGVGMSDTIWLPVGIFEIIYLGSTG